MATSMKPTRSHHQIKREKRREDILSCAGIVFARKGFSGTKIADIAKEAGISQGLLYRYFRSKDAVFTELIRNSFEKLNGACELLESMPGLPREKILKALKGLLAELESEALFADRVLLIAQATISEGIPQETKDILQSESGKPYETIARIMAAGQKDGSILPGDPKELATLFWTAIKGLALNRVAQRASFKCPDLQLLARLFFVTEAKQAKSEGRGEEK